METLPVLFLTYFIILQMLLVMIDYFSLVKTFPSLDAFALFPFNALQGETFPTSASPLRIGVFKDKSFTVKSARIFQHRAYEV